MRGEVWFFQRSDESLQFETTGAGGKRLIDVNIWLTAQENGYGSWPTLTLDYGSQIWWNERSKAANIIGTYISHISFQLNTSMKTEMAHCRNDSCALQCFFREPGMSGSGHMKEDYLQGIKKTHTGVALMQSTVNGYIYTQIVQHLMWTLV